MAFMDATGEAQPPCRAAIPYIMYVEELIGPDRPLKSDRLHLFINFYRPVHG